MKSTPIALAALRPVVEAEGPFASAYLATTHDSVEAVRRLELRARAACGQLSVAGAPAGLVAHVAERLRQPSPAGAAGRAVVACSDGVLVDRPMPEPPVVVSSGRFGQIPYLMRLVRGYASAGIGFSTPGAREPAAGSGLDETPQHDADDVVEEFRVRRDLGTAIADGLAEVVRALRDGSAEQVLFTDVPVVEHRLWAGSHPQHLGLTRQEVADLGDAVPFTERADELVIRALAGADATIAFVDDDRSVLTGGIGAFLRYDAVPA